MRSRRFRVADRSMSPTLLPGDCLYVDPGAYRTRLPERGDLVILHDPVDAQRLLAKRVAFVAGEYPYPDAEMLAPRTVFLLGDNLVASRDSRSFGAVPVERIVGRAWFRYAPADRRRTLTATFK
ncbi:MAG TPA: S26 family signal peptidase [Thermoplasmata archaeon]|nr:S26 family signal peptidase [Thermoplasmata archaeon]